MLNKIIDDYLKENYYPFHMPGHKRSKLLNKELGYGRDFTEIEGLDNLNDPKEVFVEMERKFAGIYKVDDTILSTNGSTSGILASIRALTRDNKDILIERSSHKAVYNACLINELRVDYLDVLTSDIGAIRGISYENLENKLKVKEYACVVITSPSYEGYILDLKKIYALCKKYHTRLILDMAHGSHLFLTGHYENSFDIAITSFHKNLPALTPAAAVLVNNPELTRDLREAMAIFQTSSPSYLILQSISYILENLSELERLSENLKDMLDDLYSLDLKHLDLIDTNDKDRSKILISTKKASINGKDLMDLLREEKIEIEMAYPSYGLLIASLYDTREGFELLKKALVKIDRKLDFSDKNFKFLYKRPKKIYEIHEAKKLKNKPVKLEDSGGKVAADFTYAYPPGIPILAPGELIDSNILASIKSLIHNNISLNLDKGTISCIIDKNDESC
ncbi:aminotransferase class I/II-fold pyridoxal phosphate-dependent enzyme [uncultured Anaerococcus sp.]|uniref:aminotransferase class I/II-fold pyridoxal phosphate-dependent enzyme n=1 Tax=uncultured Anaerococcus sp. TaxID=293428 RepID=UPI0025ED2EB3|nr:aminotransferase class I/II-fold pyridoxal phosphate-dependent enzyme [uncultured Anaerococcus sp.]